MKLKNYFLTLIMLTFPALFFGQITLTQSTSNVIEALGSVNCNTGDPDYVIYDNIHYRAFDLDALGYATGFQVAQVSFGIELVLNEPAGFAVDVIIYETDNFPGGTLNMINSVSVPLTSTDTGTIKNIPIIANVNSRYLVYAISIPDQVALGNSTRFALGANALGQSSPSYLSTSQCAITTPTDVSTLGFTNHYVMFLNGYPSATHLNFAGDNDFVQLPNESNFDFLGNEMTVEFWMKSDVTNPDQWDALITKGDDSWRIHLNNTGTINCAFNGTTAGFNSTIPVTDGNWHHIAVTLGSNIASLYIDGSLDISTSFSGTLSNSSFPVAIGQNLQQTVGRFFTGDIDDVRFWNLARTAEQINGSRNCELEGTESGLIAYYKFNQGADTGTNTSVTSLTDATTNANDGILSNFTLTGTISNWLAGSPVTTGSIVPSAATVSTPVVYNQGDTALPLTATTGANGTGLLWHTTATGGTGSTTAPTPSTTTAGSTSYWVSSTNANGCESERTEIVVTVNAVPEATHLNFDGVNDHVTIPVTALNNLPQGTISTWVKLNALTQQTICAKQQNGINSFAIFMIGGNGATAGKVSYQSTNTIQIISNATLTTGQWYNVTVTFNNTEAKLYIDGVLDNTVMGDFVLPNQTTVTATSLGAWLGDGGGQYLNGDLDEFRVWNRTLNETDISNLMTCELQSGQTGLVAYYKFNQGLGAGTNTSVTTLTDASGNSNNGTLSGFALNGTTSNWLAGSPITTGMPCATLNTTSFNLNDTFKLYPNPTNGNVNISTSSKETSKIAVYDINGRLLIQTIKNEENFSLDLSKYSAGIYILKMEIKGREFIRKIIKQ